MCTYSNEVESFAEGQTGMNVVAAEVDTVHGDKTTVFVLESGSNNVPVGMPICFCTGFGMQLFLDEKHVNDLNLGIGDKAGAFTFAEFLEEKDRPKTAQQSGDILKVEGRNGVVRELTFDHRFIGVRAKVDLAPGEERVRRTERKRTAQRTGSRAPASVCATIIALIVILATTAVG